MNVTIILSMVSLIVVAVGFGIADEHKDDTLKILGLTKKKK